MTLKRAVCSSIDRCTRRQVRWTVCLPLSWVIGIVLGVSQTVPLGPEFRVNSDAFRNQAVPSIASNSTGDFVVAWITSNTRLVRSRSFNFLGDPRGDDALLTIGANSVEGPSVAITDAGDSVVVWSQFDLDGSSYGVFGRRLGRQGQPLGGVVQINTFTTGIQWRPQVAIRNDTGFVVVWESHEQHGPRSGIFAQRFDAGFIPLGPEFQVNVTTVGQQHSADVAMNRGSGEFIVTWFSLRGTAGKVVSRRFDAFGTPLGGEVVVTKVNTFVNRPRVSMNSSNDFVVVWEGSDDSQRGIFGSRFTGDGLPLGGSFQVNTHTAANQDNPEVALHDSGRFVVTWESEDQDGSELAVVARDFDFDTGMPVGPEFVANVFTLGFQNNPAVAFTSPMDFVVVWQGPQDPTENEIFGRRFGCALIPAVVTDLRVSRTTDGTGLDFTWMDSSNSDSYSLFSDLLPDGPFEFVEGEAASGSGGITLPIPADSTFYLVAGRNACGFGPRR